MSTRRLRRAFLFETIVGVVTLLGVMLLDQAGIALTALLIFRPWIAGRSDADDAEEVRRTYRDAFWISAGMTVLVLLLAYVAVGLEMTAAKGHLLLVFLLALPLFMVSHGLAGYLIASARPTQ